MLNEEILSFIRRSGSGAVLQYSGTPLLHHSKNDATFLEAEIAAAAGSRASDDDMVDGVKLQNSAAFENSPGKAHIRFGRGGVTRRVVVHHDEGIRGVSDHGFKDFSWVAERFIVTALANRADLNEVLLGVEKNNAQGFTIEKPHFGTEIGNCLGTIDRERLTFFPQRDGAHPKGANEPQRLRLRNEGQKLLN